MVCHQTVTSRSCVYFQLAEAFRVGLKLCLVFIFIIDGNVNFKERVSMLHIVPLKDEVRISSMQKKYLSFHHQFYEIQ